MFAGRDASSLHTSGEGTLGILFFQAYKQPMGATRQDERHSDGVRAEMITEGTVKYNALIQEDSTRAHEAQI